MNASLQRPTKLSCPRPNRNSFNIYRCYVHLHGREAQLRLAERISRWEARHAELLQRLPPEARAAHTRRQREAAASEAALRWVMPTPIWDEAQFREDHAGSDSSDSSD